MMTLQITEFAQEKILARMGMDRSNQLILDLDDGVGPYSEFATCSLETNYQLLITEHVDSTIYNQVLQSPLGPVSVKGYAHSFFSEDPKISVSSDYNLQLSDRSGLLDSNVSLIYHPQPSPVHIEKTGGC
ncbi:iron-sulfur cluster biosynthesis family protein [Levilactobacillus bambusae]|uniref:Core domain-containing protein n=1 Tax=Levilactobacillus bambusae TaxID=2024736 RepID=A0A2V1N1I5_9LACO|nr:iron-sulfur cluster biosynthesis family protein [Levilactobacillus bambusae]PWG01074.1 hypothetical protein DCM90_02560 [Levilactobacillus bambusae]